MSNRQKLYFRRAPHLMVYWDGRLTFHNYATGQRAEAEPLACAILSCFDRWRTTQALFARLKDYTPESLLVAVRQLQRCGLLQAALRPPARSAGALDSWKDWNPAAGFFHFSTKDLKYKVDPEEEARHFRLRARRFPIPSSVKRYPRAPQVILPPARLDGEFAGVLLKRRTWRRFSRRPLSLDQLSTLLRLTGGVQRWIRVPHLGRLAMKTSPSGGARHPLELYVVALRVRGLERGIYHYAADRHRLERLRRGASSREVVRWLAGQRWFGGAAALVLMTAVLPRSQWKYQFARAYRVLLADAGHLCQTFCLAATWLGLAPFCTMALADSRIVRALGIDGVDEAILYAAGVGSRPADGSPRSGQRTEGI